MLAELAGMEELENESMPQVDLFKRSTGCFPNTRIESVEELLKLIGLELVCERYLYSRPRPSRRVC